MRSADRDAVLGFFSAARVGDGRAGRVSSEVVGAVLDTLEELEDPHRPFTVRVSKSQVSFSALRGFAYLWHPGDYVRNDAPVVLSIALPHRNGSARFKEIAHPSSRIWMHHLELRSGNDVDDEVVRWLRVAAEAARGRS